MSIAELIADKYVLALDTKHLSAIDIQMLHAIKSVVVRKWARQQLKQIKGGR